MPKKSKIFDSLLHQAGIVEKAAKLMQQIAHDWKNLAKCSAELERLEAEGDEFVHAISDEIDRAFITPFDKEDIKSLSDALDDIIDNLEQTANRLNIYKIPKGKREFNEFADLIVKCTNEIRKGVMLIQEHKINSKEFRSIQKDLHSLENQGDKLHRGILEELMGSEAKNPKLSEVLLVLKWKEIFQTLEDTLDKCEDVATVFERLRTKYG